MRLWLSTCAGVLLISWTARGTFRDLFQPSGSGALSSFVGRALFGTARRAGRLLSVAGPLAVVTVIGLGIR